MQEVVVGIWSQPPETVLKILEWLPPVDYITCLRTSRLFPREEKQYQRKLREHRGKWFVTREQAIKEDMTRLFIVHDNGGEPWFVRLRGGDIHIDTYPFDWNYHCRMASRSLTPETRTIEEFNQSARVKATLFDWEEDRMEHDQRLATVDRWLGLWAPEDSGDSRGGCAGNTVLVQLHGRNHYLLIAEAILEFWTDAPIRTFESPIGNNDVPYPYGISDNAVLFLLPTEMCARRFDDADVAKEIGWFMRLRRPATLEEARNFFSQSDPRWDIGERKGVVRSLWERLWWGLRWKDYDGEQRVATDPHPLKHTVIYPRRCDWETRDLEYPPSPEDDEDDDGEVIEVQMVYVPRNETDERV
jgi:hypothetical protein